jgi:hypothetical protein
LIDDDVGVENKKNEKKKIKRMTKCGKKMRGAFLEKAQSWFKIAAQSAQYTMRNKSYCT